MKPYKQSPHQIGPAPAPEVSRSAFLCALAFFALIAGGMAFVGASEPATCSAPVQIASK
jgi:hypothetical protein